ncbi:cytochrome c oxidase subunit 1, partial [Irineochytrium annulatum]
MQRIFSCLYWSAEQVTYPYQGELNSIFITTRIKNVTTLPPPPGCDFKAPKSEACKPPDLHDKSLKNRTTVHFIADVDSTTLLIDHAIRAQYTTGLFTKHITLNTELDMTGYLINNCDMESKNMTTAATAAPGETWRSTGMVISVPVMYDNAKTFGNVAQVKYYYVPTVINDDSYKTNEKVYNQDGSISYLDRHGIRIVFQQCGSIGQFDLQTLLLSIVAGIALLSLTTLLVDFVMIFLLKNRKLYRRLKFTEFNVESGGSSDEDLPSASTATATIIRASTVDKRVSLLDKKAMAAAAAARKADTETGGNDPSYQVVATMAYDAPSPSGSRYPPGMGLDS